MAYRNTNPIYNKIEKSEEYQNFAGTYEAASYKGVAFKTLYFIALIFMGAFAGLYMMANAKNLFIAVLVGSVFTVFIFALLGLLFPKLTRLFGSLYCLGQGVLIGTVSLLFESQAPGVVLNALLAVVVVLTVVVTLFMTNVVKVNGRFMRFLFIFAISMMISLLFMWLISLFTDRGFSGGTYFLVSALSCFLATLYLFFDLERIRAIVEGGAPKQMEWFVSFGLVYTIAWLYMELLRIIFILMDRN